MFELQIAPARVAIGRRDNARAIYRRRVLDKAERRESHTGILARRLDGRRGRRLQRSQRLELPFRIGSKEHDPIRIHDKGYVTTAGPCLFNTVEAHLYHGDADHLVMVANGLRIVEPGLAARRADAVEAARSMLDRVVKIGPVGQVHPDKARLLVPVARGKREAAGIEHVEHGTVGLGVNVGQIPIHTLLKTGGGGRSQEPNDLLPERDHAGKVIVLRKCTLEACRIEIKLVNSRVMQPVDPDPLGGGPSDAECARGRAQHRSPRPRGQTWWTKRDPGYGCVDVVHSWPLRMHHETRFGRSILRFAYLRRNPREWWSTCSFSGNVHRRREYVVR